MRTQSRSQAGDTIVEVIIAVAVVATILAGAFIVTNRSTQAVRDSEEHAQALQYLQGQVELLRAAAGTHGGLTSAMISSAFCLDSSLVVHSAGSAACTVQPPAVPYAFSITCVSAACPEPQYSVTTFNLKATWPALGGNTDVVYLSYEVEVTP